MFHKVMQGTALACDKCGVIVDSTISKKCPICSRRNTKFVPPTREEVLEYALGTDIDGNKFFDHYQAVDWKRGKNKIKDWKACFRTWKKNGSSDKPRPNRAPNSSCNPTPQDIIDAARKERDERMKRLKIKQEIAEKNS